MTDTRATTLAQLRALVVDPARTAEALTPDSVWDLAHPLPQLIGPEAVAEGLFAPLKSAITGLQRRDIFFIGGENIREEGGTWCAAIAHYVGNMSAPFAGITPDEPQLVFLRAGEFYRIEGGRIAKARIIFDFPDLLRQLGRYPFPGRLGTELTWPAPATLDGVLPTNRERGPASLAVIEGMIDNLRVFDPETFSSEGQTGKGGFWHDDMYWYGPAGIGSNHRWDGFVRHHRESFLRAFPDRLGGNHYCRIGDGDFAAISGWPSMTMTHQGDYLGAKATGRALTLRVMDFYRCAEGQIMENWVSLDYGELFHQMGIDLLGGELLRQ